MNQFKRAAILVLESSNNPIKGDLILRHVWKKDPKLECISLWRYNDTIIIDEVKQYTTLNSSFRDHYSSFKTQYVYVTTNDEIKVGDYYYDRGCHMVGINPIRKYVNQLLSSYDKKIISTNDPSLDVNFPQPSNSFLDKYLIDFKEGNIIKDVLVEYVIDGNKESVLKVRKDNTITIKKIKTSYTKEEFRELLKDSPFDIDLHYGIGSLEKWIEDVM